MGKFRNQKRNLIKNRVAISTGTAKQMKAALKAEKKDGEVDVDEQMTEELPKVRGLAVSSLKKLASGELTNVPKVNDKKKIRRFELPVRENKKLLDAPTGKRGTTAQYITKKKAKKMLKKMTHDARDNFEKIKAARAAASAEAGQDGKGSDEAAGEEMEQ